jgi:Uncharacterized protein conserved in bacteria
MEISKDIFSGLEALGFNNMENLELYKKEDKEQGKIVKEKAEPQINEADYLFDRKVVCPVCGTDFTTRTVKKEGYQMKNSESDFYMNHRVINPYFYDVCVCNVCGYSSMKADFEKLRSYEVEKVQQNITPKWTGRKYPEVYDINIAIERYKLSLFNYTIIGAKASKKAMNCLKLSWMYREINDEENEKIFREQALIGFKEAYFNEDCPIYGMDKFRMLYLIGELNRRSGNYDEALRYFGEVITSTMTDRKTKKIATEQKDLIKEHLKAIEDSKKEVVKEDVKEIKKPGFFSRFFGKSQIED